jgi:CheY-like chemotaxis protein
MPTGGTLDVSVRAEEAGGWVGLVVSDTGTGMSDEAMAHVFEPFFTTKSRLGTGLGLSTVRRIATGAGGDVQITSRPGAGTIVRLRLPLVAGRPPSEEPSLPQPARGAGHILVVDDEPAVRRVLTQQLTQAGYQVSDASDGAMALARLRAAVVPVDLVLTDLVMPNMGGEALARQMAREFPGLPVLCMSGTPGLATGNNEPWSVDQVIAKPADVEVVTHRIARALALRSLSANPAS